MSACPYGYLICILAERPYCQRAADGQACQTAQPK